MLSFLLIIEDEETRSKVEEIYLQYHNEMYTIAYAILKQAEDAEDVVQSSIIKLADYVSKISEIKFWIKTSFSKDSIYPFSLNVNIVDSVM